MLWILETRKYPLVGAFLKKRVDSSHGFSLVFFFRYRKTQNKLKGGFSSKNPHNATKLKGDHLVSPGIVCYAKKEQLL